MPRYESRKRQGFMIYHDDLARMMKIKNPADFKKVFEELYHYSVSLSDGISYTLPELDDGRADSMLSVMAEKIDRDNDVYERKRHKNTSAEQCSTVLNSVEECSTLLNSVEQCSTVLNSVDSRNSSRNNSRNSSSSLSPSPSPITITIPTESDVLAEAERLAGCLNKPLEDCRTVGRKFYTSYCENNWKVNGEPVKNWTLLLKSWIENERQQKAKQVTEQQYGQREYPDDSKTLPEWQRKEIEKQSSVAPKPAYKPKPVYNPWADMLDEEAREDVKKINSSVEGTTENE